MFTHPHGDHSGLYKKVPADVPMYIGPMAKEILKILISRLDYISGRPVEHLHTSGHAYVETIARLIETVDPKVIVPMHTERAEEFSSIQEFAPFKDRIRVLKDGEPLSLESI